MWPMAGTCCSAARTRTGCSVAAILTASMAAQETTTSMPARTTTICWAGRTATCCSVATTTTSCVATSTSTAASPAPPVRISCMAGPAATACLVMATRSLWPVSGCGAGTAWTSSMGMPIRRAPRRPRSCRRRPCWSAAKCTAAPAPTGSTAASAVR